MRHFRRTFRRTSCLRTLSLSQERLHLWDISQQTAATFLYANDRFTRLKLKTMRNRKLLAAALVIALMLSCQEKTKRAVWVRPWVQRRLRYGAYHALLAELHTGDAKRAKNFLRMDPAAFKALVDLVRGKIQRKDTQMRGSIPVEERLAVTLRYLASGRHPLHRT